MTVLCSPSRDDFDEYGAWYFLSENDDEDDDYDDDIMWIHP